MGHKERSRSDDSDDSGSDSDDNRYGGGKEDKDARKARKKAEKAARKAQGGNEEHQDKKDKKEKKGKHQGQFEQFAVEQPPPIPGQHRDAYPAGMPPSYNPPSDFSPGHGPNTLPVGGEAASFFAGGGAGLWQGQGNFAPPQPQQPRSWSVPQKPPPPQQTHAPSYPMQTPPPSGVRIPLSTDQPFPAGAQAGEPPFRDLDGSPVFVGSALFENPSSVHPCKIAPNLQPPARVPYGGGEHEHNGRYDLLPIIPAQMEWVRASGGAIPNGRRPIEGGYENGGGRLFHGYAEIHGIGVPGKVGEHLGGLHIAFGGQEITISNDYYVLCWRM